MVEPEPTEEPATAEPTTAEPTTAEPATAEPTTAEQTTATGNGDGGDGEAVEVLVGPEGRLRFDPPDVSISVGDTIRWPFESAGHNVTSLPGASRRCQNPEGAEPFASYEGNAHYSINEVGTVFEHTFTVPGEYVYVCAPHADQGMVGTITVSE